MLENYGRNKVDTTPAIPASILKDDGMYWTFLQDRNRVYQRTPFYNENLSTLITFLRRKGFEIRVSWPEKCGIDGMVRE